MVGKIVRVFIAFVLHTAPKMSGDIALKAVFNFAQGGVYGKLSRVGFWRARNIYCGLRQWYSYLGHTQNFTRAEGGLRYN